MLENLVEIVKAAGELIQEIKASAGGVQSTSKQEAWDPVTLADTSSQEFIVSRLRSVFPGVAIVAEEDKNPAITEENFFVVDPLDGTAPFIHNMDTWGVTVAYMEDYQPKVGVIYLPERNVFVTAEKNKGTFLNGKKVHFAYDKPLNNTLVVMELGPWVSEELYSKHVIPVSNACMGLISTRSAIGGAVLLLEQKVGVCMSVSVPGKGPKIWDYAAASLAVTEAGGCAVNMNGGARKYWPVIHAVDFFLAANDVLAVEVLSANTES